VIALLDNTVLSNFSSVERPDMQIPVSGTLGLLVRLVDQGFLSLQEADDLLRRMIVAGYRSPVTRLAEIM